MKLEPDFRTNELLPLNHPELRPLMVKEAKQQKVRRTWQMFRIESRRPRQVSVSSGNELIWKIQWKDEGLRVPWIEKEGSCVGQQVWVKFMKLSLHNWMYFCSGSTSLCWVILYCIPTIGTHCAMSCFSVLFFLCCCNDSISLQGSIKSYLILFNTHVCCPKLYLFIGYWSWKTEKKHCIILHLRI